MRNHQTLLTVFLVVCIFLSSCGSPALTQSVTPSATTPPARLPTASAPPPVPTPAASLTPTTDPAQMPLQAAPDLSLDLAHYPSSQPFMVTFNHPMNVTSPEQPLLTYPDLPGKVAWNTAGTELTFTPAGRFTPGQDYYVFLNPNLKDAANRAFEKFQQWKVHVTQGVQILSRTPDIAPGDNLLPTYTLVFDRLMDRASVERAFTVSPAATFNLLWSQAPDPRSPAPAASGPAGSGSLLATATPTPVLPTAAPAYVDTLTIVVTQPLTPGVLYRFSVLAGAAGRDGFVMDQDVIWSHHPIGLRAEGDINFDDYLALTFNYPMEMEKVAPLLSVTPAIGGSWKVVNDETIQFIPSGHLSYLTNYTITASGPLPTRLFSSLPPFQPVVLHMPAPVIPEDRNNSYSGYCDGRISISFAAGLKLDLKKTASAFTIEPVISGSITWTNSNSVLVFVPDSNWTPNQKYTATLGTGAADANGVPILSDPYQVTFKCSDDIWNLNQLVFATYGTRIQAVDASGRRAIQFGNPPGKTGLVTFGVTPLTTVEFARRYSLYIQKNPYYYDVDYSMFTDIKPLKTWQVEVTAQAFDEMLLPASIPPGLYLLSMTQNNFTDYLFLVLTHSTLTVKSSLGHLYVWAADFNGQGVPNLPLSLYDDQGSRLLDGKTGPDGLWTTPVAADNPVALVVAANGPPQGISLSGDVAVAGLDGTFANYPTSHNYQASAPYVVQPSRTFAALMRAYIYTDRPIYQPGQVVNFKVIVRQEDDARYATPPEKTPVKVDVLDARQNPVASYDLATDAFGAVDGSISLASGAMLGSYQLKVEALDGTASQTFEVQQYVKPEFQVSLKTSASALAGGQNLDIDVDVTYFTGQPVVGATLSFQAFTARNGYYFYNYDCDCSNFEPQAWTATANYSGPGSGVTDANGHFHTSITVDSVSKQNYYNYWPDWMLQVDAFISNGQTLSQTARFKVYPSSEFIDLNTGGYLARADKPVQASLKVTGLDQKPVAGRDLSATLAYDSWYNNANRPADQTAAVTTDQDGNASLSFTVGVTGWYELTVTGTDAFGNEYSQATWMYVTDNVSFDRNHGASLAIKADKTLYQPYDTAHFKIVSNFSGPAMLTFERGSVLRSVPITLTAPLTEVTQPIGEEFTPNVFVTVNAWTPSDTLALYNQLKNTDLYAAATLPDHNLVIANTEIQVDASLKQLKVSMTADQTEYGPCQEASFTLQVTDAQGQPVQAEVSLALVDEAIFSLRDDPAGPMLDAFYGLRSLSVGTYDQMSPRRVLYLPGGRGGGGGDGGITAGSPRSNFADTALWLPAVVTDANGKATVKVTLPDNLTRWRLTARAVSHDTRVGEATLAITTTQPTILRPVLPTSLTQGDHSELGVLVSNTTARSQSLSLRLEVTPASALALAGDPLLKVTLAPGETQMLSWGVLAAESGALQVTMTAEDSGGGGGDAIQLPLTVNPFSVPAVETDSGVVGGEAAPVEMTAPLVIPDGVEKTSTISLSLSRSLAGSLVKGLVDLTHYPYGCVEQTMSAALPNAVVGRAFNALGMKAALPLDLNAKVSDGLQRLYAMQHQDGGWGWWTDDDTDVYMTAWVLFGLSLTREAGYPVAATVTDRAVKYLDGLLISQSGVLMDDPTLAFVLYSLALAGKGDLPISLILAGRADALDSFSQAALALALQRLDEHAAAVSVLDLLARSASSSGSQVFWISYNQDGQYHSKTMASTLRSTALAMDAFLAIRPDDPLVPLIENYLMAHRGSFGWGTTNETAFAVLALTDRLVQAQNDPRPAAYILSINGAVMQQGQLDPGADALKISIPIASLETGANLVHLATTAGGAPLYYILTSTLYIPQTAYPAAGVIDLQRAYLTPDGYPIKSLHPGDLVLVQLTYTLEADQPYLMLEDHLPGGLEALNERLNTSGYTVPTDYNQKQPYYYSDYGYNWKEIRGDRVLFFITTGRMGSHIITYLARVGRPGHYRVLSAEISSMYDVTQWGRSASDDLVVLPAE